MTRFEKTVDKIRSDLNSFDCSRDEYLAICAKCRIDELNRKYDADFDRLLKIVDHDNFDHVSLRELADSIKYYSDTITKLYDSLVRDVNHYKNNLMSSGS